MKLQNTFAGIAFNQLKAFQKFFIDSMMDEKIVSPIREQYSDDAIEERRNVMHKLADPKDYKLYFISQKVQEHADLIKYEKINLGWFRSLSEKKVTYILNKNEFYSFWINEAKSLHIVHFYPDATYGGKTIGELMGHRITDELLPMSHMQVMKWDTFVVRLKEYPDGHMPVDPNADNTAKEFFVKLLLFIELSEIVTIHIKPNQKVNVSPTPGRNFDNKVKNDSGTDVVYVTTNWNKIIVIGDEFEVSGHIRIQPHGPKRSEYKLIWIEEYKKTGYIRRASKNVHESGAE